MAKQLTAPTYQRLGEIAIEACLSLQTLHSPLAVMPSVRMNIARRLQKLMDEIADWPADVITPWLATYHEAVNGGDPEAVEFFNEELRPVIERMKKLQQDLLNEKEDSDESNS